MTGWNGMYLMELSDQKEIIAKQESIDEAHEYFSSDKVIVAEYNGDDIGIRPALWVNLNS